MSYRHTQRGPLGWLLVAIAVGLGTLAWVFSHTLWLSLMLASTAVAVGVMAAAFWWLTVEDRGEFLSVRYGPLPPFGTRVRYSSITGVEVGRSSFIDGWGIHYIPGRGWTFNIWGWDCVVIRRGSSTLRVGTDDADGLARFLAAKVRSDPGTT